MQKTLSRLLCVGALAASPAMSHAFDGITDRAGDFLSTFAGSTSSLDLDVVSATVLYDPGADMFQLISTMSGAIGTTSTGLYVWGVNRGAGVASFAANGIDGVRFDRVIVLRPDGTGSIGAVTLAPGSVTISGNTISAFVSGSLLPANGFTNKLDYTWNLWPRDGAFTGFAAISDFAPDNANFSTTLAAVPEPGSLALMLAGLGTVGWFARRGTRRRDD